MKIDPWVALVAEGNHDLIAKLKRAMDGEAGFGTIVINGEGFSEDDNTHHAVLNMLRRNGVRVVDVQYEIGSLELSLLKGRPKFLETAKP